MTSPADPETPAYADTREWIKTYLTIHSLGIPSRRYSFILWFGILAVFLTIAVFHWSGLRGEFIGAAFSKWSLRRRTVTLRRKNRNKLAPPKTSQSNRQINPLPSNEQLLHITVLVLVALILSFAGPDYLDPSLGVFQFQARSYDTSTPVSYKPQYTISKSLWSSSARTGQIAFALFPLCVLFALKAPPFAVFAISFMTQIYFDKLAYLHKWTARLIWLLAFIHVTLWSIQLAQDVDPSTGRAAYVYAWSYTPFRFGWAAFTLLTLTVILSLRPIRRHFYESFYSLHVLLVPCMLLTAGLHHPSVAWWCWVALSIWISERLWRLTWWTYTNIIVSGSIKHPPAVLHDLEARHLLFDASAGRPSAESYLMSPPVDGRAPSPLDAYYHNDDKSIFDKFDTSDTLVLASLSRSTHQRTSVSIVPHLRQSYIPPPGYVHAELLSGCTIRLRLVTPGFLSWSPGQHFLINIPSISRLTSHPFTCASICDAAEHTGAGRIMLFLVRRNEGWTKDLWNHVSGLTTGQSRGDVPLTFPSSSLPTRGVLLRAYIDGPFGTVARVRWGNYSTAVIIVGGSGVSFGVSLLQYLTMCLAGRDGKQLGARPGGWGRKDANLTRVRFIWLVREYSHIQWCASIIRHCMSIVPPSALQVNIYVTNFKPTLSPDVPGPSHTPGLNVIDHSRPDNELRPPRPSFASERSPGLHYRSRSMESIASHESCDSDVDLSYYLGEDQEGQAHVEDLRAAHDEHMLDLTNFDGDVDLWSPGEARFNRRLEKEGKLRRRETRKKSTKQKASRGKQAQRPADNEAQPSHPARDLSPDQHTDLQPQSPKEATSSSDTLHAIVLQEEDIHSAFHPHSMSSSVLPVSSEHQYPPFGSFASPSRESKYGGKYDTIPSHSREPSETSHDLRPLLLSGASSGSHASQLTNLFEVDEQEAKDVNVVSEHARPGKPKLDKVIADEMEVSEGTIVVACCGPISLNKMARKLIAAQIDPDRIRRGDMRGSITLISEEFDY